MSRHPLSRWLASLRTLRSGWWAVAVLGWLVLIAVGVGAVWRYQLGAGATARSGARWPVGSTLPRAADRATVIQFIHPRCPCSRASLESLRSAMAVQSAPPALLIVFLRPGGTSAAWTQTASWRLAERIPGAQLLVDSDGKEAARFGALTSGQTFAFAADGTLSFSGGITPARGEAGDSVGRQELLAALARPATSIATSRVYGCALLDPNGTRP
jgi:hypothetical protein